jgi:hypothetical protein
MMRVFHSPHSSFAPELLKNKLLPAWRLNRLGRFLRRPGARTAIGNGALVPSAKKEETEINHRELRGESMGVNIEQGMSNFREIILPKHDRSVIMDPVS